MTRRPARARTRAYSSHHPSSMVEPKGAYFSPTSDFEDGWPGLRAPVREAIELDERSAVNPAAGERSYGSIAITGDVAVEA